MCVMSDAIHNTSWMMYNIDGFCSWRLVTDEKENEVGETRELILGHNHAFGIPPV